MKNEPVKILVSADHKVSAGDRAQRFGHAGGVLWLTGLSASGKSTLAMELEQHLLALGYACFVLDGDNVRQGLNADLGFSPEDRCENIRRVGEVAALFAEAGLICITSFISPYCEDRQRARQAASRTTFHEVYLAADAGVCEQRDPKGLYLKARQGLLKDFTGVDAPYEIPVQPEVRLDTGKESLEECCGHLLAHVLQHFPLSPTA